MGNNSNLIKQIGFKGIKYYHIYIHTDLNIHTHI